MLTPLPFCGVSVVCFHVYHSQASEISQAVCVSTVKTVDLRERTKVDAEVQTHQGLCLDFKEQVPGRYLHFLTPELQYINAKCIHCSCNCFRRSKQKHLVILDSIPPTLTHPRVCFNFWRDLEVSSSFQNQPATSQCQGQDAPAHPLAKLCATCSSSWALQSTPRTNH